MRYFPLRGNVPRDDQYTESVLLRDAVEYSLHLADSTQTLTEVSHILDRLPAHWRCDRSTVSMSV